MSQLFSFGLREKKVPVRFSEFGFIPKGAIGTGSPTKFTLWGDSTVGLSYKPEAQYVVG